MDGTMMMAIFNSSFRNLAIRGLAVATIVWLGLPCNTWAQAKAHLLGIKIAVTNPSGDERIGEPVVIPIAELRKIAPDFRAASLSYTVSHATELPIYASTT